MLTVGIDEVGRGCWAGPLVAAAVLLPPDLVLEDGPIKLRDSKKMTKKQREVAAEFIKKEALAVGIGWVWPAAIDSSGITQAVKTAMHEALSSLKIAYDEIVVDGNINYFADNPLSRSLVRADDLVPAVSAASIIAKVARDNYMSDIAASLPGYGFERHVGYGTAAHIAALRSLGVSSIHRRSYKPIKALLH
jgi:ribonuclease HII